MAWVDQDKKAIIAAELKKAIPAGWKTSLAVRHGSTIVLTISAAPVDLCEEYARVVNQKYAYRGDPNISRPNEVRVNEYYLENQFDESLEVFEQLLKALNTGNYNNDDVQTDYFDRGHYVDINIGRWNKPFQFLAPVKEAA